MKKIPLTPYPREVRVFRNAAELERAYKKFTGRTYDGVSKTSVGHCVLAMPKKRGRAAYLVFGKGAPELAHEFGHVLLDLFSYIRSDPTEGNGEPFCYMLSHLMEEAARK